MLEKMPLRALDEHLETAPEAKSEGIGTRAP
jgi:hypothetical protein